MHTEALITELSKDFVAVEPLRPPLRRFLRWGVVASLILVLACLAQGIRSDLSLRLHDPSFVLETLLLIVLIFSSGHLAFLSNIPGITAPKWYRALPWISAFAWGGLLSVRLFQALMRRGLWGFIPDGPSFCTERICLIALVPALILLSMLKKGEALQKELSGVYLMFAAAGVGALAAQLTCVSRCPFHLLVWHLLPVCVFAIMGRSLISRLL